MKKVLSLVLATLLATTMMGCGNANVESTTDQTDVKET